MKIGIYTSCVSDCLETIIYWLFYNPDYEIILILPDDAGGSEHDWCLKRLYQHNSTNIRIVPAKSEAEETDLLYIQSVQSFLLLEQDLKRWSQKSQRQGLLSYAKCVSSHKQLIAEYIYAFPYTIRAKSVIIQTRQTAATLFPFIKNRCFYSPSMHPQLIVDKTYLDLIFQYNHFLAPRTYRFTFLGNINPPERIPVLREVKETLQKIANPIYSDEHPTLPAPTHQMSVLWIEYGDRVVKRSLQPSDYIDALQHTDFCICPLGWGGNWTHRVIESLVCGAIPILEDEQEYNIGLQDMKHCIVVKDKNWGAAIERAYRLTPSAILEMRANIKQLREQYLVPEIAAQRFRQSIGLT